MILLKDYNLLFIKSMKVGGSSFELGLSKFANKEDIITPLFSYEEKLRKDLGFASAQNYKFTKYELLKKSKYQYLKSFKDDKLNIKFFDHIPAEAIKNYIGKEYFDSLHKVAIVRNPFSTLISRYYWSIVSNKFLGKEIDINKEELELIEKNNPPGDWIKKHPNYINQNDFMLKIDNRYVVDTYIKFENFEYEILDFEKNFNLIGFSDIFFNIKLKSSIKNKGMDKQSFFSDASLKNMVEYLNEDYMKKFDYTF